MDENVRPDDMERITTPELAQAFIDEQVAAIREQVGDKKVLLALSGGVDSSVVAALLIKAIGKNLVCVHVNHGLMRKGESEQVIDVFQNQMDANLVYVDATDRFLDLLAGVDEPETKRKIIGGEFIRVFEEEARKVGDEVDFLAQGTIYPDILESQDGVKAHHNVGGLPDDLQFELVEPVKLLFKDEVRVVGRELGLPENMVERQPFPGPGLGVRCLGAITRDRLEALREADLIIYGIGSLYTSVIPNLIIPGIPEAIYENPCPKIYFCNAMTQPGETEGYTMEDHVRALEKHSFKNPADLVVLNDTEVSSHVLERYARMGSFPVHSDETAQSYEVWKRPLITLADNERIRHDPEAVRQVVQEILEELG